MPRIVIIDFGMGNIRSVQRGIERVGSEAEIIAEGKEMEDADAVVLPGVGAFGDAVANLSPFSQGVLERVEAGVPLLGICLGLQLLFTKSTEGGVYRGLDILKGRILRLPKGLKVPQIGWNTLKIVNEGNPLIKDLPDNPYVYFVHSYYAEVDDEEDVVALTNYGVEFPSIVSRRNVFATQFHPEKSGKTGLRILKNFVDMVKR